jgi:hypothetical protein
MKLIFEVLGRVGGLILFIGLIMKTFHFQFSDLFILAGGMLFLFFFVPWIIKQKNKS